MDNKIKEISWLRECLHKMAEMGKSPDYISFYVSDDRMSVHMTREGFHKYFGKTGELVEHDSTFDKVQRIVDGIEFFCLVLRHE